MLNPALLTHLVREAVDAVRTGDLRDRDEAIGRLVQRGEVMPDLLAVCRVFAASAVQSLRVLYGPEAPTQGEMWVLGLNDVWRPPAQVFAARVVTAHANSDSDMVTALVSALHQASGVERCGSLRELLMYAAQLELAAQNRSEGKPDEH